MTDDRHAIAGRIFADALDRPAAEREAYVVSEADGDAELAAEVFSLLEFHEDDLPEPPAAAPLVAGTLVADRYRLDSPIGAGGMGEVWRATDTLLGEPIAIKAVRRAAFGAAPGGVSASLDEIRLARRISHPNICRVHDAVPEGDRLFLTMELVDGEDLSAVLARRGRLPPGEAIDLVAQAAAGLAAAHGAGILHRDFKPANLLVGRDGRVRVTDFGLAELAGHSPLGPLVGTPAYMAPELLSGQGATERTEVFALAMVLYEAIAGRLPIASGPLSERVSRLRAGDLPPLSSLAPDVPPELDRTIRRALSADPADRFDSVLGFAGALPGCDPLRLAAVAGVAPSVELLAATRTGEELSVGRRLALAGVLLGALGIHVALQAFAGTPSPRPKSPAELVAAAERIVAELGHDTPPADRAFGFDSDRDGHTKDEVTFWYRRFDRPRTVSEISNHGRMDEAIPLLVEPGDLLCILSIEGLLLRLEAVPPEDAVPGADTALTEKARSFALRPERLDVVTAGDRVVAAGKNTHHPENPKTVALTRGRIVSWLEFWLLPLISIPLGLLNLRAGRGYPRGALRAAVVLAAVRFVGGMFCAHHPGDIAGELQVLRISFADALMEGALAGLAILAVEPIARRYWPESLVATTRLLQGRFRDPLVGISLTVGAISAVVMAIIVRVRLELAPGRAVPALDWFSFDVSVAPARAISNVLERIPGSVGASLLLLVFAALFRALLRNTKLAAGATFLLFSVPRLLGRPVAAVAFWLIAARWMVLISILLRAGVLAACVAILLEGILVDFPPPLDPTAWWAGTSLVAPALTLGIGFLGLALAGRKRRASA